MSYGIIRVQKFKASAVSAIQFHNLREKESRTNPDIDKTRSGENIALTRCSDFRRAVRERLETLKSSRAVRKDAVVMVEVLVTSGPEFFQNMPKDKQREYFRQSLNFIADRYGKENILSAVVHMDERTPHMHVDLTPIRDGRLSAKAIFTRSELGQLQTDFHTAVGKKWNLQRGESREEKRHHLSTEEYKLRARREDLEKAALELRPERLKVIQPEDVKPKRVEKKLFGILPMEENEHGLAVRLNAEFIKPAQEKLDVLHITRRRLEELEEKYRDQAAELKKLRVM